jgi:hypothetical protein
MFYSFKDNRIKTYQLLAEQFKIGINIMENQPSQLGKRDDSIKENNGSRMNNLQEREMMLLEK